MIARDLVQHDMDVAELGFPRGQIPFSHWRFLESDAALLERRSFVPAKAKPILAGFAPAISSSPTTEMASHAYLTEELAGDAVEMEGASVALDLPCQRRALSGWRAPFPTAPTAAPWSTSKKFLPIASHNSLDLVLHVLSHMKPVSI